MRELRPVPRLRRTRRDLQAPRRRGGRLKRGQLDSHILVLVTLGLTAFGLVMVYSATSAPAALGGGDPVFYLKRESIYAAIGVVLLLVASRVDYRTLRYFAPVLMLTRSEEHTSELQSLRHLVCR